MYTLKFFVREINKDTYATDYEFYQNDNLLEGRTYMYHARVPVKHFNEAVARIRGIVALSLSRKFGVQNTKITKVCTNPKSDFLTRAEMSQRYWDNRFNDAYGTETETKMLVSTPAKIELVSPTISKERLYEVVEVGGVWTIKKHDDKWYTAEEAKTQLFAHVVNGD